MTSLGYNRAGLGHDAPARTCANQRRYPSVTVILVGMPVVFLLVFVYILGGTLGTGLGHHSGGRVGLRPVRRPGDLPDHDGCGHHGKTADLGRDGHDGGDHRPVPDDGHLPHRRAVRSRARRGDPDRCSASRWSPAVCAGDRVPAHHGRGCSGVAAWRCPRDDHICAHLGGGRAWATVAKVRGSRRATCRCFLLFLPFLGGGFVPTHSLPSGVRWFAEYQPFTPFIETLRGLLPGERPWATAQC